MNYKKIAVTAGSVALLLGSVVPAFAHYDGTVVVNKWTKVKNDVTTMSNTGSNELKIRHAGVDGSVVIDTGNARAKTVVINKVNKNTLGGDESAIINKGTRVKNDVGTMADTGSNTLTVRHAGVDGDANIITGDASAKSVVVNVVNTNTIGE